VPVTVSTRIKVSEILSCLFVIEASSASTTEAFSCNAVANSPNVSRVSGAELTRAATC